MPSRPKLITYSARQLRPATWVMAMAGGMMGAGPAYAAPLRPQISDQLAEQLAEQSAEPSGEAPDKEPAQTNPSLLQDSQLRPTRDNGRDIYRPENFSRFNPRSALDMVEQIPGFNISGSDGNERGLGQASQNVLINGKRISGKSNDAATALSRINADSVVRLEIVDGATLDIPGLSGQVLNLVINRTGLSGNFSWTPRIRERTDDNLFEGEVSVSGKLGKADFTITLANDAFRGANFGIEDITAPDGSLLFQRDEIQTFRGDRPTLTLFYGRTSEAGSIFNFNGNFQIANIRNGIDTLRTEEGVADISEPFSRREDERNFEISADYEFALGGGRLKLIGFQRFEHSPEINLFQSIFSDGQPATGSRFEQTADEGESILRSEYGWQSKNGNDWQFALEGAFNFLDTQGDLFLLDEQGVFIPDELSNATSRVEEYRGEGTLTYGRKLAKNLALQANIGVEYSQLRQSGPAGLVRSFVRPKGSVALTWNASKNLDINATLERDVGQLNFGAFIADVDLANDNENAGNPLLVPEQSWNVQIEAQRNLGSFGNLNLRTFYTAISDIIDRVPITATAEANGNLDSAVRYGAELNGTLLLDPIGYKGARVDLGLFYQRSRVDDPLTGIARRINGERIATIQIDFRHDISGTQWAWGGALNRQFDASSFRLDQRSLIFNVRPQITLFVENKDVLGLTVRASARNIINQRDGFLREISVDRRDGPLDFIERREREFGVVLGLDVSGTF